MSTFLDTYEKTLRFSISEAITNTPLTVDSDLTYIQHTLYTAPDSLSESTLLSLLYHKDLYTSFKSCSLLTDMYMEVDHKKEYIVYYKYMLKEDLTYEEKNFVLECLLRFLSCKYNVGINPNLRKNDIASDKAFSDLIKGLIVIKELQYNILLILYIFSFNQEHAKFCQLFFKSIICILKDRSRQKIIRVCYLVILNVLNTDYKLSIGTVDELKKITHNLVSTNVGDDALLEDIKSAEDILQKKHNEYDIRQFITDLFQGIFEDHDFHYDETFWQNGLDEILKNKVELIKIYKKYMKSHNLDWIRLACNDVYMIVKVYPEINVLISKFKVRDVLFDLTKSENDDIRFMSVQALYTCIFTEWS